MYHLLGSTDEDEARGYALLLELFDAAAEAHDSGTAFVLVRLANEQAPELADEHRLGLAWLEGRLEVLQGRAEDGVNKLSALLARELPDRLRPLVELSLAQGHIETGAWVDAIDQAQQARRKFSLAREHVLIVQAQLVLAQAYTGLARSRRGTRLIRTPISNPILAALFAVLSFFERLPILIYLSGALASSGFWYRLTTLRAIRI